MKRVDFLSRGIRNRSLVVVVVHLVLCGKEMEIGVALEILDL